MDSDRGYYHYCISEFNMKRHNKSFQMKSPVGQPNKNLRKMKGVLTEKSDKRTAMKERNNGELYVITKHKTAPIS